MIMRELGDPIHLRSWWCFDSYSTIIEGIVAPGQISMGIIGISKSKLMEETIGRVNTHPSPTY